jgi:hypothetical protein
VNPTKMGNFFPGRNQIPASLFPFVLYRNAKLSLPPRRQCRNGANTRTSHRTEKHNSQGLFGSGDILKWVGVATKKVVSSRLRILSSPKGYSLTKQPLSCEGDTLGDKSSSCPSIHIFGSWTCNMESERSAVQASP